MEKVVRDAYYIAKKALKSCSSKDGYFAGLNRFKNYWARDAFFASLGGIKEGDLLRVKKQLILFIRYQKRNGHIPRLILNNPLKRFFSITVERIFNSPFATPFLSYFSRDQNSLFVISAWKYIKHSKDYDFAKTHFESFEKAINWNFKYDINQDLLIEEGKYADWADSIAKDPCVLFTNICSYKALRSLSKIADVTGNKIKKKQYLYLSRIVKDQINEQFWTGEFYTDSLKIKPLLKKKQTARFDGASNMLAIFWNIADEKKGDKIFNYIKEYNLEHFSIEVVYPPYLENQVFFLFRLMNIKHYHNGMVWLWIGCIGTLAYKKLGQEKKAMHLLRKISRKIVEFNDVYEVYEPSGEPVKKFFYQSAHPFAWSAGLFIYAYHKLKYWTKRNE